jgi:hypothetical protein
MTLNWPSPVQARGIRPEGPTSIRVLSQLLSFPLTLAAHMASLAPHGEGPSSPNDLLHRHHPHRFSLSRLLVSRVILLRVGAGLPGCSRRGDAAAAVVA